MSANFGVFFVAVTGSSHPTPRAAADWRWAAGRSLALAHESPHPPRGGCMDRSLLHWFSLLSFGPEGAEARGAAESLGRWHGVPGSETGVRWPFVHPTEATAFHWSCLAAAGGTRVVSEAGFPDREDRTTPTPGFLHAGSEAPTSCLVLSARGIWWLRRLRRLVVAHTMAHPTRKGLGRMNAHFGTHP